MTRQRICTIILGLVCSAGLLSAQSASVKQPKPKSQKELDAIRAIFNAPDADSRLVACNELLTKFADTEFKVTALQVAAMTYQQKGDLDNMIIYAERTLEADPVNYASMLMIAMALAQRTREFDLDKEEKLGRAEKLARQSLELIPKSVKPRPDLTDEQWEGVKKDFESQAHEALGLSAMVRKKPDLAAEELKKAVDASTNPDPATLTRLGSVYNQLGKHDDAIAALDRALADPAAAPVVRKLATEEKIRANQAKAKAAEPPKP
jgi:tetratricopeptide (TPR) repeat protein